MADAPTLQDPPIHPRLVLAALWTSVLFVFVYVDLFSLYRPDFRADLEAGTVGPFDVSGGFLLFTTTYVVLPSLLVALSLLLPARLTRRLNLAAAGLYSLTILTGFIGEWGYYVLGSAVEVALLAVVGRTAWRWPVAEAGRAAQPVPTVAG